MMFLIGLVGVFGLSFQFNWNFWQGLFAALVLLACTSEH